MERINILSIDGGGIRGVYATEILVQMEKDLKINICSEFDLIVGTSTGSIVAGALSIGLSPKYILEMYVKEVDAIFTSSILGGVLSAKYDNKKLKEVLDNIFMGLTFADTKTNLLVTSTNITKGIPEVFESGNKINDGEIKIADAILASCSTPLYFNPVNISNQLYADGGLWANNPALAALIEAKGYDVRLISLGSGFNLVKYNISWENKEWGATRWGTNLVELIFNLQSLSTEDFLNVMMNKNNYLRINFDLQGKLSMDDIKSLPLLIKQGGKDYRENRNNIIRVLG